MSDGNNGKTNRLIQELTRNEIPPDQMQLLQAIHTLLQQSPLYENATLLTIIDHLPATIYTKDRQSRHLLVNQADLRIKGVKRLEDVAGKTDFDFFERELAQELFDDEQYILRTGQPLINKKEQLTSRDGTVRWLLITKIPWRDANGEIIGIIGIGTDITNREQEVKILHDISKRIVEASDLEDVLEHIASGAIELMEATSAVIYLVDQTDGDYSITRRFTQPDGVRHPEPRIQDKSGITYQVVTEGKIVAISDTAQAPQQANPGLKELGIRAMIALPLKLRETVKGVLFLNDSRPRQFNESEIQSLRTLAEYAVIALEHSQSVQELKDTLGLVARRTALAWMGMASNIWYHEIRGQATTIADLVTLAKRDIAAGETKTSLNKRLDKIEEVARKILNKAAVYPPASSGEQKDVVNDRVTLCCGDRFTVPAAIVRLAQPVPEGGR